jgi:hypothetical protein
MNDVVGLRFVAEGERETLNAAERVKRGMENLRRATETLARAHGVYSDTIEKSAKQQMTTFVQVSAAHKRLTDQELANSARRVQMMQRSAAEQDRTLKQSVSAFQHVEAVQKRFTQQELADSARRVQMMQRSAAEQDRTLKQSVSAFQHVEAVQKRFTQQELADSARRVQMMQRSAAEQDRALKQEAAAFQYVENLKRRFLQQEQAATDASIAAQKRRDQEERGFYRSYLQYQTAKEQAAAREAREQERAVSQVLTAQQRRDREDRQNHARYLRYQQEKEQAALREAREQERAVAQVLTAQQRRDREDRQNHARYLRYQQEKEQAALREAREQERAVAQVLTAQQRRDREDRQNHARYLRYQQEKEQAALREAREQERAAAQVIAAQQRRDREDRQAHERYLRYQREKEQAAAREAREQQRAADEVRQAHDRAKQGYDQLRAAIDPAVAAQQRLADAQRRVDAAIRAGLVTQAQGNATMAQYRANLTNTAAAMLNSETAAGRLRAQMLATANSIAILDGPLGGVASRFSAFGVLIGRTGLLVGGLLVSLAALGAVLNRGVRNLMEWEVANARVNAILETTGYQVGLTGEAIRAMTSQIALNTLESEQSVMAAAQRLLTFRDIAGSVFEDVLKAATDMAALGFGTVESETVKLAKALEDPAQALTSLSRAGIVFTRQQRALIISLVESGRQAEAMERILANVNARVGGAAEAAARDTLAGAFDTIGQAAGRAVREVASTVLQVTGLDSAIRGLAASVANFAAGPATTEQRVRQQLSVVQDFEREIAEMQRRLDERSVTGGSRSMFRARMEERQRMLDAAREELQVQQALLRVEEQGAAAARAENMLRRDTQAIDDLAAEIDLRREIIGLTEDEQRLQRNLAQLGLRDLDIGQRVGAYSEGLRAAGVDQRFLTQLTEEYRTTLAGVAVQAERAMDTDRMARMAGTIQGTLTNLDQQNTLLAGQVAYMQQGLEATEARARAEEDIALIAAEILADMDPTNARLQEMANRLREAFNQARDLRAQADALQGAFDAAAAAAGRIASALSAAAGASAGLGDRIAGLTARVNALRSGADQYTASARESLVLEQRRLRVVMETGNVFQRLQGTARLEQINIQLERLAQLQREAAGFGGAAGGGGGGAESESLASILAQLDQRIEREQTLLQLTGQARIEQELYYEITDQLRQLEIPFREENVRAMLRERAERLQAIEDMRQQQRLQEQLASTMTNLFMAATRGADAFKQALAGVLTQLAQMLANRAFTALLGGLGGGAGGGGFWARIISAFTGGPVATKAANGHAFMGGNVVPFAKGGVVNSPTTFPMSRNRTGLMGEAGPEAVIPLRRGRDGKLGVGAEPQNVAVDVRVHVDDNGNWRSNVERIADSRISRAAPQIVSQSVQSTYAASSERRFR